MPRSISPVARYLAASRWPCNSSGQSAGSPHRFGLPPLPPWPLACYGFTAKSSSRPKMQKAGMMSSRKFSYWSSPQTNTRSGLNASSAARIAEVVGHPRAVALCGRIALIVTELGHEFSRPVRPVLVIGRHARSRQQAMEARRQPLVRYRQTRVVRAAKTQNLAHFRAPPRCAATAACRDTIAVGDALAAELTLSGGERRTHERIKTTKIAIWRPKRPLGR